MKWKFMFLGSLCNGCAGLHNENPEDLNIHCEAYVGLLVCNMES
jgi:hypothetical protein